MWKQKAKAARAKLSTDAKGGATADGEVSHGGFAPADRTVALATDSGPEFPRLGVTLDFLERFVQDKVAGKASRYCVATTDCTAASEEYLSFKKGDILAIADLNAVNDGWFVGYARAGNWNDRKRFRPDAVERLSGLTTDEVCGGIIKPETSAAPWPPEEKERSYARMVLNASSPTGNARIVPADGETGVGDATVFASHAWTFVFAELIESLRFFENQQIAAGQAPSYFWLDIFVVDENAAHTYPSEWWQTSFTQAVGSIGHTALVLTPWRSPVPLRRAWCLWEIFSTLSKKARLSVCMSESEMQSFHGALVEEFDSVLTSLCTIDAETAEAGSKKDLDMIFAAVRTLEGGFQTLNATVMEQMREWLIESMRRALAPLGLRFEAIPVTYRVACAASGAAITDSRVMDLFEEPCECCYFPMTGEDRRITFGNWYRMGAGTKEDVSICANHYQELSRLQKRKWKAVKSVADLGAQADLFAEREFELVGELRGSPEEAAQAASLLIAGSKLIGEMNAVDIQAWNDEAACRKAQSIRMDLFGRNDPRTAEAICELSKTSGSWNGDDDINTRQEYRLLVEALEIRKATLPEDHVDIADSLKFLGRFFHENHDDQKTALPFYMKALAIYEGHDPSGLHVDTVSAVNDVACALEDLGRLEEARVYAERAYRCSYEGQGPRHSETAAMASNLALLIAEHFRHEVYEAVPLLRLGLKTCEVLNGVDNPDTQEDRKHLGQVLLQCVALSKSTREANSDFGAGDRVRLGEDRELNRSLAHGHGGWEDDMDKFLGEEGAVKGVDSDGDVVVQFDIGGRAAGLNHKGRSYFHFNPEALQLISKAADQKVPTMSLVDVARTGTKVDAEWSGTDEEAEQLITDEAEELLLRALAVLEKEADQAKSARLCADLLVDLYEESGKSRKKEMKAMQKRMDALQAWCSSSSDDSESDESDSGSEDGSVDSGKADFVEVQDILLAQSPDFERALQPGHDDEHVSLAQLDAVIRKLAEINQINPPRSAEEAIDRYKTRERLEKKIEVVRQRDRAVALLGTGWDTLVAEGTPSPRTRRAGRSSDPNDACDEGGLALAEAEADPGALTWTVSARPNIVPSTRGSDVAKQQQEESIMLHGVSHGGSGPERDTQPGKPVVPAVEEGVPPTVGMRTLEPRAPDRADDAPAQHPVNAGNSTVAGLAGLAEAVQAQALPSHAFGRAATTGASDSQRPPVAEAAAFDSILSQLGLSAHADALRATAIVNVDELRDMTVDEMREDRILFTEQEIARVLAWQNSFAS